MKEKIILQSEAPIPTKRGTFRMMTFASDNGEKMPEVVMLNPDTDLTKTVNLRIHSECMTGDLFGSQRCECGEQLDYSLRYINKYGGLVIYLRQEGRGIGLINKLNAYKIQDTGRNTLEANLDLGFHADSRTYEDAIEVLRHLGVNSINLLTNNPEKVKAFEDSNIVVEKRVPVIIEPVRENVGYINTKREDFGHFL